MLDSRNYLLIRMANVANLSEHEQATRRALRTSLRAKRNALTPAEQQTAAEGLLDVAQSILGDSHIIAAYLPNDGEISPQCLINQAWAQGKTIALPVLHPFHPSTLLFVEYRADSTMTNNRYGIPEPRLYANNIIPVHLLDTIFVPLVGFDLKGNRMGMGGGFYDRTLAYLTQQQLVGYTPEPILTQPNLIGLAHSVQQIDAIPVAQWDIPMSHILTAQNCITIA